MTTQTEKTDRQKNKGQSFWPLCSFVLTWTIAVPVLLVTALALLQFFLLFAASERLGNAALFGVREAARPQASRASVLQTVDRHIKSERLRNSLCAVQVELNDGPLDEIRSNQDSRQRRRKLAPGDQISVSLLIDPTRAVPDLVGWTGLHLNHRSLVIRRVERVR